MKNNELIIPLQNGGSLRYGNIAGNYIRICDENQKELIYWDIVEWEEDPELLGTIFNAALQPIETIRVKLQNITKNC